MSERIATYTWGDVVNVANSVIRTNKEEDLNPLIANAALNKIWHTYDWRESLAVFPPFWLTPLEQDYGAPALVIPSDFWGLRWAELIRVDTTPPWRAEMRVIKDLQLTSSGGLPQSIGYEPTTRVIRIFPRPPENLGSPPWLINGKYKKKPVKVTAANLATTVIPWDDTYIQNVIEVTRWAALNMVGDPRAGAATVNGGQLVFTGQMANAVAAVEDMASQEGLEMGDPVIAPAEPLVGGGSYMQMFQGMVPLL